jgi:hypothetical protein
MSEASHMQKRAPAYQPVCGPPRHHGLSPVSDPTPQVRSVRARSSSNADARAHWLGVVLSGLIDSGERLRPYAIAMARR